MSKILIVDDNSTFVNLLSEELTTYGQFEVLTASAKGEEVDALKQGGIDIVILDISAGNIDGLEFLALMSTTYPHIPSIVMTRKERPVITEINNCSTEDFIFCYMEKPFDLQKIGGEILLGLHRLDENDFAPGISVTRLLYLLETSRKTCRVQVKFGRRKQGFLDINKGILQDAFCGEKEGKDAALEIIGWPPISFRLKPLSLEDCKQRITPEILDTILVTSKLSTRAGFPEQADGSAVTTHFGKTIKLLIVDDSRMMRKVIANIFAQDETIEVVGEAANGKEALQVLPQLNPDVVTLDVQMPVMDGLTTLKHMMIKNPTPTVMLSSYTREGAVVTFDALKYGAVDFVAKPSNVGGLDLKEQAREISKKVHLAAQVELGAVKYIRVGSKDKDTPPPPWVTCDSLIVMGAAEGAYGTLTRIIPQLPATLPAACLVILYTSPQHVDSFVKYLNPLCSLTIQRAKNNDSIEGGVCYFASGEEYLTLHESDNGLTQDLSSAPFASRRGSINMLMFSVAEIMNNRSLGIILSGRGQDGNEGLEEIIRVGGSAIIQDPTSCLYKDMPQAALKRCSTAQAITDNNIAQQVINRIKHS